METAIKFGEEHDSCPAALAQRRALPLGTTQKGYYETICNRGDWLLWQLERLSPERLAEIQPLVVKVREQIVTRAITLAVGTLSDADAVCADSYRNWAAKWLDGSDRSRASAAAAAAAERAIAMGRGRGMGMRTRTVAASAAVAASDAAWGAAVMAAETAAVAAADAAWGAVARRMEQRQQCANIRALIPAWPGGITRRNHNGATVKKTSINEWLDERKKHIGASEVAAILGVDPRRGPLAVYEAKISGFSTEDNVWMKYGRDVEGAIANMYEHETGRPVANLGATAFQNHPDVPFLAATLDRITRATADLPDPNDGSDARDAPLELKSVDPWGAKTNPNQWREDPPLQYQLQMQAQIACIKATWGSLAGMFPGYQLAWKDLLRDDDLLNSAYPVLEQFWGRVQRRDPPPVDELPGTLDVAKRMWKSETGETVSLDADWVGMADEWEKAKTEARDATKNAKTIEAKIRAELRGNTFGLLVDGTMLTLKTTKRQAYTRVVEASEYRTLRRKKV